MCRGCIESGQWSAGALRPWRPRFSRPAFSGFDVGATGPDRRLACIAIKRWCAGLGRWYRERHEQTERQQNQPGTNRAVESFSAFRIVPISIVRSVCYRVRRAVQEGPFLFLKSRLAAILEPETRTASCRPPRGRLNEIWRDLNREQR